MKILVVDDEKNIRESIAKFLTLDNFEVIEASNGLEAKKILEEIYVDLAIVDLRMPEMDGVQLLGWINTEGPQIPLIMISAFGEIKDAVNAMKKGAIDYIVKPFDPDELIVKINKFVNEKVIIVKKTEEFVNLLSGKSKIITNVKEMLKKISKSPTNVLVTGESGTGKEVVAKMIHLNSGVNNKNFIPINIGGIPENLLESELFGYEKGAFTGAVSRKIGMFEEANGGTLFLDEIGDMPLHLQVKLLRVLQERKLQRLGSNSFVPIDFRLICATNKDLKEEIRNNRFREDLYYRLNVVEIKLPPLRERKEDIEVLVEELIKKFNIRFSKKIMKISDNGLRKLVSYDFPGNVRELENIIERAFIFSENNEISEDCILLPDMKKDITLNEDVLDLEEREKVVIQKALEKYSGNRTRASEELGISRKTLISKIKKFNLKGDVE